LVHVEPVGVGTQAPFTQVVPVPHEVDEQSTTHWPLSHTSPAGQSLEYLHALAAAVHAPAAQTWPLAQSFAEAHGQGPFVPPHVSQTPLTQAWSLLQSLFALQAGGAASAASPPVSGFDASGVPESGEPTGVPGLLPGGTQYPPLHASPWAQSLSTAHVCSHPCVVHTEPLPQSELTLHGGALGEGTLEHE
jgi:hypothetical protein